MVSISFFDGKFLYFGLNLLDFILLNKKHDLPDILLINCI